MQIYLKLHQRNMTLKEVNTICSAIQRQQIAAAGVRVLPYYSEHQIFVSALIFNRAIKTISFNTYFTRGNILKIRKNSQMRSHQSYQTFCVEQCESVLQPISHGKQEGMMEGKYILTQDAVRLKLSRHIPWSRGILLCCRLKL